MSDADIPIEDKINALKGALRWREEVLALRAENKRLRALLDEAEGVEAENDRLREALKGLVGLVHLVRSRTDCPVEIKQVLTDHYRLDDAFAALAKEAGE